MKTVASLDQLQRRAMGMGAVVSIGGRTINSKAERAQLLRQPAEPDQAPEPLPAPAPQVDIERLIEGFGDKLAGALRDLRTPPETRDPAPVLPAPAPAPRREVPRRTLRVEYDGNELIRRIVAEAAGLAPIVFTIRRDERHLVTDIVQE